MIKASFSSLTSVSLTNNEHTIVSDVAKSIGGNDEGLNPHELVEAALAACTTLTLEMYARRKNWDIKKLQVEIKIIKEGAESTIERNLIFPPDFTAEMKSRLLEIAKKCPIHKLLESNIKIETYEK